MDLVRAGAIPALIAVTLYAGDCVADCAALQGSYKYDGISSDGSAAKLGDMVMGSERNKIQRVDRAGNAPGSLNPSHPISRGKVTHLAQRGDLVVGSEGTHVRFFDASGRLLVEASLDRPQRYKCDGSRLVRVMERMAGLGDNIRTERVEEVLEVNPKGELVHRESSTVIEGSGKPGKVEQRFPRSP